MKRFFFSAQASPQYRKRLFGGCFSFFFSSMKERPTTASDFSITVG